VIVLDASVLIAHLDSTDVHHGRATEILLRVADESLGASPLSLAEVLVGPARAGQLDQAIAALTTLGLTSVELEADAPSRLARLRAEMRLKLPDCCVVVAAEQVNGDLVTFDERLATAARDRGITVWD